MSEIKVNLKLPEKTKACDVPVGTFMICVEKADYKGEIFLKTYDRIVSLTEPKNVWADCCPLEVVIIPKDTVITITV